MAYSRWGNSMWYIYHSASSSGRIRNDQYLTVRYARAPSQEANFSYHELKTDLQAALDAVKKLFVTPAIYEMTELKAHCENFLRKVEEEFKQ